MPEDVAIWLEKLGLGQYAGVFVDNDIEWNHLPDLDHAVLQAIGVKSAGNRMTILKAAAAIDLVIPDTSTTSGTKPTQTPEPYLAAEAERRQLTVMFCDLVGSTAISERMDPEEYREVIAVYQSAATKAIQQYEGYIARYMGDGLLVYFGYPLAHEDDAERAVRAGLGIVDSVRSADSGDDVDLQVRVGIATGLVVVGDIVGEGASEERAVLGDTPNLAARLQTLAEPETVLISEATHRLTRGLFEYVDAGSHELKGFTDPVRAWQATCEAVRESRFDATHGAELTALVGRDSEIALLDERWERAKEGEGQVLLLSGEAGIGKSRLALTLRDRIGDKPHIVLRYQCSPYHVNSAFYPFIEQLQRAAGFTPEDTEEFRLDKLEELLARSSDAVGEIAPLIGGLLSIQNETRYGPLNLSPQRQKEKTIEALTDQLGGLAGQAPVLVLFEDVHWADPTTLDVLSTMIDTVQNVAALVVITHRPEFESPWRGRSDIAVHSLTRLGRRQAEAVVARVTEGKGLPEVVLEQILEHTDGVPLFIEELTKTVLEGGLLREVNGHYVLDGPLPPLAVPSTLQDSLTARLDRLAPVKEVAQIGATIGRQFSFELILAVCRIAEGELEDALEYLVDAQLLSRRGRPPEARYSFKHALVQDAACASLLKATRKQIHARIAHAIEVQFPQIVETQPEVLAYHYTEAVLPDKAVDYGLMAGRRATQRSAHLEAVAHLRKALEMIAVMPQIEERNHRELDVQLALGASMMTAQGASSTQTAKAYTRAHELCEHLDDPPQLLQVKWAMSMYHGLRAEWSKARKLQEELLRSAEEQRDEVALMNAHRTLGFTLYSLGELVEAQEHLKQAVRLYDTKRHGALAVVYGQDPGVGNLLVLSWDLWALGYPDKAVATSEQAVELAGQLDHPHSQAYALFYAAVVRALRGEYERALERAEAAIRIADEYGFPIWIALSQIVKGEALAMQSDSAQGIEKIRQGLMDYQATGATMSVPTYLCALARALFTGGHFEEVLRVVEEGMMKVLQTGERRDEVELKRLKGEACIRLSREADGEASLQSAIGIAREQGARSLELRAATSLARLWFGQGKCTDARDLLDSVYNWFTEGFDSADLREAMALRDELI
jgi:class 3 adenylate cyclase/predicted ATPase